MREWSQLLVIQLSHLNQQQQLQELRSHLMFNLLLLLWLAIQLEEKNNGNNGPKISKIMEFNKRWLLIPEFLTSLHSNLEKLLNL